MKRTIQVRITKVNASFVASASTFPWSASCHFDELAVKYPRGHGLHLEGEAFRSRFLQRSDDPGEPWNSKQCVTHVAPAVAPLPPVLFRTGLNSPAARIDARRYRTRCLLFGFRLYRVGSGGAVSYDASVQTRTCTESSRAFHVGRVRRAEGSARFSRSSAARGRVGIRNTGSRAQSPSTYACRPIGEWVLRIAHHTRRRAARRDACRVRITHTRAVRDNVGGGSQERDW